MLIDSAPIEPREFGPCLLFGPLRGQQPRWFIGEWDGRAWCDEYGALVEPTRWAPLPEV
jgi:hypothetical protein